MRQGDDDRWVYKLALRLFSSLNAALEPLTRGPTDQPTKLQLLNVHHIALHPMLIGILALSYTSLKKILLQSWPRGRITYHPPTKSFLKDGFLTDT